MASQEKHFRGAPFLGKRRPFVKWGTAALAVLPLLAASAVWAQATVDATADPEVKAVECPPVWAELTIIADPLWGSGSEEYRVSIEPGVTSQVQKVPSFEAQEKMLERELEALEGGPPLTEEEIAYRQSWVHQLERSEDERRRFLVRLVDELKVLEIGVAPRELGAHHPSLYRFILRNACEGEHTVSWSAEDHHPTEAHVDLVRTFYSLFKNP